MVNNILSTLKQFCQIKEGMSVTDVSVLISNESIILPTHKTKIYESYFTDLLLTCVSLTPKEKICLLLLLPSFSQADIDTLISILEKEKNALALATSEPGLVEQNKAKNFRGISQIVNQIVQTQSLTILNDPAIEGEEI